MIKWLRRLSCILVLSCFTVSVWSNDYPILTQKDNTMPVTEAIVLINQHDTDKLKLNTLTPKAVYILKRLPLDRTIWNFLTEEMGLSDVCAAGVFGNMMVECGGYSFDLQPYIYSPGGYYYGLCQWGTTNHHREVNGCTVEEQLSYLKRTIVSEMGQSNYEGFTNAQSASEASIIFARWYERCGNPYGRQRCAERAYERFTN